MNGNETFQISLRTEQGAKFPAIVALGDESGDDCTLTLTFGGRVLAATGPDYFEAFCEIRTQLEPDGIIPMCFAASGNVYPSGMCRNMGYDGLKAYRLTMGMHAKQADLVSIFDSDRDVVPTTVEEQKTFFDSWLKSIQSSP